MLLELEGGVGVPPVSESIVRKYTWGLDLVGLSGDPSRDREAAGLESAGRHGRKRPAKPARIVRDGGIPLARRSGP